MGYLAVFGHTNIDYLAAVKRFPAPGGSMEFLGPKRALGGTAANIAVYAARLGTPVKLASFVGNDFPEDFARRLSSAGVDLCELRRVPGESTPVCWVFSDAKERQIAFISQGAVKSSANLPVQRRALVGVKVVHLATGNPTYHLRVASAARKAGLRVSFDPGQELAYLWTFSSLRSMLGKADTLFLNDLELAVALRFLRLRGAGDLLRVVPRLVLTHGRRGSQFLSREGSASAGAVRPARVVNTTGAGDAFRAGYYAAAFRGLPPEDQLKWGNAAASFAVESTGAQEHPPTARQLLARLRTQS